MSLPKYKDVDLTNEESLNKAKRKIYNKFKSKVNLLPENEEEAMKATFTPDTSNGEIDKIITSKIETIKETTKLIINLESYIVQGKVLGETALSKKISSKQLLLKPKIMSILQNKEKTNITEVEAVKKFIEESLKTLIRSKNLLDEYNSYIEDGTFYKHKMKVKKTIDELNEKIDKLNAEKELIKSNKTMEVQQQEPIQQPTMTDEQINALLIKIRLDPFKYNLPSNIKDTIKKLYELRDVIMPIYQAFQESRKSADIQESQKKINEYEDLRNLHFKNDEEYRKALSFVRDEQDKLDIYLRNYIIANPAEFVETSMLETLEKQYETETEKKYNRDALLKLIDIDQQILSLQNDIKMLERHFYFGEENIAQLQAEIEDTLKEVMDEIKPKFNTINIKEIKTLLDKVNSIIIKYYDDNSQLDKLVIEHDKMPLTIPILESSAYTSEYTKVSSTDVVQFVSVINKILLNFDSISSNFDNIIANSNNISKSIYDDLIKYKNILYDSLKPLFLKIYNDKFEIKLTSESQSLRPNDLLKLITSFLDKITLLDNNIEKLIKLYNPSRTQPEAARGGGRNNGYNNEYIFNDLINHLPNRFH
jgi:hypothetical protein